MSILLDGDDECSSKAEISYLKGHRLTIHQQIVWLKIPTQHDEQVNEIIVTLIN